MSRSPQQRKCKEPGRPRKWRGAEEVRAGAATSRLLLDYRAVVAVPSKHHLLEATTKDDDCGQGEDHAEDKQPGDHEKGPVGSARRRLAGPPSPLPSGSPAAGC